MHWTAFYNRRFVSWIRESWSDFWKPINWLLIFSYILLVLSLVLILFFANLEDASVFLGVFVQTSVFC